MKNKILSLFLASLMIIPLFSSVFAVSYQDFKTRLNNIKTDINSMKNDYENILATYPNVIDALSPENKENALTLTENVMADGIKAKIDSIKAELGIITVSGATDVLDAINNLEDEAQDIFDENEDIIDEIKSGYMNLTIDEVKYIIDEVNEITDSLGYSIDTTDNYNKFITILDEARIIEQSINDKLNDLLDESANYIDEIVSLDFLKELFEDIKNKDREAIIETIEDAVDGTTNEANIKPLIGDIKEKINNLKNKFKEIGTLDEKALIKFDASQKLVISNKAKDIENDYIDYAKNIVDVFAEGYIHELSLVIYDEDVDDMIDFANDILDFIAEYKDTIKKLYNNPLDEIKNHTYSAEIEDLLKKGGILVAIGFFDTVDYSGDFFYNKFKPEMKAIVDYVSDEFLDYIDHIDVVLQKEISDEIADNTAGVAQTNVRTINLKRFTTVDNIKALKERIENEIFSETSKFDDTDKLVTKVTPLLYKMCYINMLDAIEKIMLLENEKDNKSFEYNEARGYILTDSFMNISDIEDKLGIPNKHIDIISHDKLNGTKVMTTSTMDITFTEEVFGNYIIAVLGDVYADGKINSQDYMAVKNEIMGTKELASINKIAANTYRDNKVDSRDYMKIKNYIMKGLEIKL